MILALIAICISLEASHGGALKDYRSFTCAKNERAARTLFLKKAKREVCQGGEPEQIGKVTCTVQRKKGCKVRMYSCRAKFACADSPESLADEQ